MRSCKKCQLALHKIIATPPIFCFNSATCCHQFPWTKIGKANVYLIDIWNRHKIWEKTEHHYQERVFQKFSSTSCYLRARHRPPIRSCHWCKVFHIHLFGNIFELNINICITKNIPMFQKDWYSRWVWVCLSKS